MSDPPQNEKEIASFDPVLGHVPSGIFILTVRHEEQETGMLASWVMQAGFDPPMVTVAVKKGRDVEEWLTAGAAFALCLVAVDQKQLLGHFGRGFDSDAPAFEGLQTERDPAGAPVLTTGSLGYLSCLPQDHVDSGDHRIFLARVVGGRLRDDSQPMIHVRNSGSHY